MLRPIEQADLPRRRAWMKQKEMGWTEYGVAMLLFSGVSLLLLYVIRARAAVAAVESAEARERGAGLGLEYRRLVHHEHELAVVLAANRR